MTDRQGFNCPEKTLLKERQLEQLLGTFETVLVAFSGGVDSTFLLSKALEVVGKDHVLAVTISSALSRPQETEEAEGLAQKLQARQLVLKIDPLENDHFSANGPDRCYHCKRFIYRALLEKASAEKCGVVLDGSNADDRSDYRPGLRALEDLGIRSPLLEVSLGKDEIRKLARKAGLPVWDKPAAACLASRLSYGEKITEKKLSMIGDAESFLRRLGVKENLRVRCHGSLARIEANKADMGRILAQREAVFKKLQELGFVYVTLDLHGFESGSMNRLLAD
jgi:pyridinium-3,5-biscarboxylic acid mononucleotide sulfurtransferase